MIKMDSVFFSLKVSETMSDVKNAIYANKTDLFDVIKIFT